VQHKTKYVVLPLRAKFKGETGTRNVLFVLSGTTDSGIPIRRWFEIWVTILRNENGHGPLHWPAFCDKKGDILSYREMNAEF